jgi:diguanylate cyclase (GGDEF)-like protein
VSSALALAALFATAVAVTQASAIDAFIPQSTGSAGGHSTGIAPRPTTVDPLELAGLAGLGVIALLLLLYFYRRRLFILCWIAAWGLAAASAFLTTWHYASVRVGHLAYGVAQFLGILSALTFVTSADAYRRRPQLGRRHALTLLAVLIWFALAPLALGTNAVFAPGHLLIAGGLAAAGLAHLTLLRETRLFGAAIVGAMLLLVAVSHVLLAINVPAPDAPEVGRVVLVDTGLYLLMAIGMQLMTFEDMTYELRLTNHRLESAQGKLRQLVTTDPLTGCRNRRFFDEIIGHEMQQHRRYQRPLSLLFVDVNRFKIINDTLGHQVGDRVLHRVAAFLMGHVRGADQVFRWGGDEFLILMSCREEEAQRKGEELQDAFVASPDAAALPPGVGLSVGCAEVPTDATDIMEIVRVADARMYRDKRRRRRETPARHS